MSAPECCEQGGNVGDGVTRGGDGMEGNGHTMACAASATAINHYGLTNVTNCVPLKELGPHPTANNGKRCPQDFFQWEVTGQSIGRGAFEGGFRG